MRVIEVIERTKFIADLRCYRRSGPNAGMPLTAAGDPNRSLQPAV